MCRILINRFHLGILFMADQLIDFKCINAKYEGMTLLHTCVLIGNFEKCINHAL